MRLASLLTGLALTAPLLLQALTLLFVPDSSSRPRYSRSIGALALVTCGLIVVNLVLWATDLLIVAPELGLAMMQGRLHCALRAMIIVYALVAALIAKSARLARDFPGHSYGLWSTMCLASGLASTLSVVRIGEPASQALQVYGYDLYAPTLNLFILGCLLEWLLVVLDVDSHKVRLAFVFSVCMAVSMIAVVLTRDPSASLVLSARRGIAAHWPFFSDRSWTLHQQWWCAVALTFMGTVGAAAGAMHEYRRAKQSRSTSQPVRPARTWSRASLLIAMAVIVALSLDLFYFRLLPELFNLVSAALVSILWIELISGGAFLDASASLACVLWGEASVVRSALKGAWRVARSFSSGVGAFLRWLFSGDGRLWTAVKIYLLFVAFAAVSESSRRGHVVIHTFHAYGFDEKTGRMGAQFAESVRAELAKHIDVVHASALLDPGNMPSKGRDDLRSFRISDVQGEGGGTAVQDDMVELGPAKLPVEWLTALLFGPARWLLWGREVHGSVYRSGDGFGASAHTGSGASWRVDDEVTLSALAAHLAFEIASREPAWRDAGMTTRWPAYRAYTAALAAESDGELQAPADPDQTRERVIAELRRAIGADPKFSVARHRLALALAEEEELGEAATQLRLAANASPSLSLVRHELAQLLSREVEYGRPWTLPSARSVSYRSEAQRLWEAILAQPQNAPSEYALALAHLGLCRLGLHHVNEPFPSDGASERAGKTARLIASFYHCSISARAFRAMADSQATTLMKELESSALNSMGVLSIWIGREHQLDRAPRDDQIRYAQGCSAYSFDLGELARQSDPGAASAKAHPFVLRASAGHVAARRYFLDALGRQPDDPVLQCNLAETEQVLGDMRAMERLQSDPHAMQTLCIELVQRVSRWGYAAYYEAALERCERALKLDPHDIETLNATAYGFHVWHRALLRRTEGAPPQEVAERAERHARDALRLSRGRRSDADRSLVESTLGEVLLSRGRPHEAIPVLHEALRHVSDRRSSSEIHHDLAQAYVCAELEDRARPSEPGCADPSAYVGHLFDRIRELERDHEDQPYTISESSQDGSELDLRTLSSRCIKADSRRSGPVQHTAQVSAYVSPWWFPRPGTFKLTPPESPLVSAPSTGPSATYRLALGNYADQRAFEVGRN